MHESIDAWVAVVPGLRGLLEAGTDVLDLECGTGETARALAARFPRCRVIAFDRSADNVRAARDRARAEGLARVHFAQLDWRHTIVTGFALVITRRERVVPADRRALAHAVDSALAPGGISLILDGRCPYDAAQNAA